MLFGKINMSESVLSARPRLLVVDFKRSELDKIPSIFLWCLCDYKLALQAFSPHSQHKEGVIMVTIKCSFVTPSYWIRPLRNQDALGLAIRAALYAWSAWRENFHYSGFVHSLWSRCCYWIFTMEYCTLC